jgi:hypothetical protein
MQARTRPLLSRAGLTRSLDQRLDESRETYQESQEMYIGLMQVRSKVEEILPFKTYTPGSFIPSLMLSCLC